MWPVRRRGRAPHLVAAGSPAALRVPALIHNLAQATGGAAAYCAPSRQGVTTVAGWPHGTGSTAPDLETAVAAHGATTVTAVAGAGWVLLAKPGHISQRDRDVLAETADWVGVAVRLDRLRGDRDRAAARAERLAADLRAARGQVVHVRELERRRLVGTITSLAGRELAEVRRRTEELRTAIAGPSATAAADELQEALNDLIDHFRTVVRGVHPAMLPERGPHAALEELAAVLRGSVRFRGDLGRRASWEVESGLYHAAAAALNHLAARDSALPVVVDLAHVDGVLRVDVTAPAWPGSGTDLRSALADDAERLAVLGGDLACSVTDQVAAVSVRLPERLGAAEDDTIGPSLTTRVRALIERGWLECPDQGRWSAIADRLGRPPRLAVVGQGRSGALSVLLGVFAADRPTWYVHSDTGGPSDEPGVVRLRSEVLRGVAVLDLPGQLTAPLAEALLALGEDGVDAVVCTQAPDERFRRVLRSARQRVEVVVPGPDEDVRDTITRRLSARADAITARRALTAVEQATRDLPADHPVRHDAERIRATAHEIAELDLLDELEADERARWFGSDEVRREAMLLLGAHGTAPHERLGLAATASSGEIRQAAAESARRWRARGECVTAGLHVRAACEVLVRTGEGLATDR